MARYFLEVAYMGTRYGGFQVQQNAITIQSEVEHALSVLHRRSFALTGSSRTDSGVHALQNFFHFDDEASLNPQLVYKLNAILPPDIVIKGLYPVADEAHSRFQAVSREYNYHIYNSKNPFLQDRAYYFPYPLDMVRLQEAAALLLQYNNFQTFSKRNTQVKTFICTLSVSEWEQREATLVYRVRGNRFLRGMVRALVGTMLRAGRGKISLDEFREIIRSGDCTQADFSAPAHGLFLVKVNYPS